MNVYSVNSGDISSSVFDIVEADDTASLLNHTPSTKILGLDKSTNDLYFYDGTDWQLMSGGVTSGSVPAQVTGLSLQAADQSILVSWNSVANTTNYKVYMTSASVETLAGITSALSYNVSGLTNGVSHTFSVLASNSFGDGVRSTSAQATPSQNLPAQVTGLSATAIGITSAAISWDSVVGAVSYKTYITPAGGEEVLAETSNVANDIVTNLTANTAYTFKVAAVSIGGEGTKSSGVIITTQRNLPSSVGTITLLATSGTITLNWGAATDALSYQIERSTTSGSGFSTITTTSATTYVNTGLTNGTTYYYRIVSINNTGNSSPSSVYGATPDVSSFVEYTDSSLYQSFSGMMTDIEPNEGNIPSQGRTYSTGIPVPRQLLSGAYYDYIDITFANMSLSAANGMKIFVKPNTPYADSGAILSAAVTQNITTGWLSAAVNISAAEDTTTPTFKTIRFNLGTTFNGQSPDQMIFKMFVPPLSAAKYARTFTTCGAASYEKNSMYSSFSRNTFSNINLPSNWRIGLARADGDMLANQQQSLSASNWTFATGQEVESYYPPSPSSIPWMLIKWHQVGTVNRKIIEMVGDSIMQGYGDRGLILSVDGITERLNFNNKTQNTNKFFVNFGQSGSIPEEYLSRWEGMARSTSASAMVYSIFSPNGYFDNGTIIDARIPAMSANCVLAENLAAQYGRVFIPCWITNTNIYQLNTLPASAASQNTTYKAKELYDWAIARYGNRLLNLQSAIDDETNTIGINMDAAYTQDQTHPNENGINALGSLAISQFDTVYANCLAAM
jgi:hypothetical protein